MTEAKHVVAIVGGAVAGSEAANVLAERGVISVVFEQNPRPYGKIEDGLPRWHVKQRRKEYEKIGEKLGRPEVHFVPLTTLGKDVAFDDLLQNWGFSAVLLANGAWRDRPLALEGVERCIDRGLVYQNPFVYWFNHFNEATYRGPQYEIHEGVAVIGGGLASIDVVKILQVELVRRRLAERHGIQVQMLELEKKGIPKILSEHGLTYEGLGVKGCTLYYRRRVLDMPLADYPDGADDAAKEKTHQVRAKILANAQEKFLFEFVERSLPVGALIEGGDRMVGVRFIRTEIQGRKVVEMPGTEYEVRAPMVISSIGSIPMPIPGLAMKGETYEVEDWDTGKIKGAENLWGLGNVVTGKGNIRASLKHGQFVAEHVARTYLGLDGGEPTDLYAGQAKAAAEATAKIADRISTRAPLPPQKVQAVLERVRARQRAVGHDGSLSAWLAKVTPPDME